MTARTLNMRIIRGTAATLLTLILTAILGATLAPAADAAPATPALSATPTTVRTDPGVPAGLPTAVFTHIHYNISHLGYTVHFTTKTRPQRAITDSATHTITIYLHPGQSIALTAKIVAYEIGHIIDFDCNTLTTRTSYLHDRHAPTSTHWWATNARPEWTYGSGDFADTFSLWATRSTLGYVSQLAPAPTNPNTLTHYYTCTPNPTNDFTAP